MWKWQREVKKKSRNKMKISPQPPLKIILFEKWQIFFSQQTMQKAKTFSNKHGSNFFLFSFLFIFIFHQILDSDRQNNNWTTTTTTANDNVMNVNVKCRKRLTKNVTRCDRKKKRIFFFLNKRNISRFFFFFFILMVWIHSFSLNLNVFFLLLQLNKWMNFNRKKNFLNHYERMLMEMIMIII